MWLKIITHCICFSCKTRHKHDRTHSFWIATRKLKRRITRLHVHCYFLEVIFLLIKTLWKLPFEHARRASSVTICACVAACRLEHLFMRLNWILSFIDHKNNEQGMIVEAGEAVTWRLLLKTHWRAGLYWLKFDPKLSHRVFFQSLRFIQSSQDTHTNISKRIALFPFIVKPA